MKSNRTTTILKHTSLLFLVLMLLAGCERDLSDDVVPATFPNTADIYTDNPVGLTDEFFISFDPADFANPEAFGTDDSESYDGTSSIRLDVPANNDPGGTFVGGIFLDRGAGRDLTEYDALTFWAKASTTATFGQVGFGNDFEDNTYVTTRDNIQLSTDWRKYIVPIPDASKLTQERGMFIFAAGSDSTGGAGYVIWIDELRFENLGTVAQLRPRIFAGEDIVEQGFTGSTKQITGLGATFNAATGGDIIVNPAPSYFEFESSDPSVATVNELGEIFVIGVGTTTITAQLDGVLAQGSLVLTSSGALPPAPIPLQPQENVKSIFSDTYVVETTSDFNPGFGGSTTQTTVISAGDDEFLSYATNNFTGILFDNTVDASGLSFMHIDVFVLESDVTVGVQIRDVGPNQEIETDIFTGFPTGDDVDYRVDLTNLTVGEWNSFDILLAGDLTNQRDNLGALILVGGPNFILDNIYFYSE